jgi:hypothetical protein
MKKLQTISVLFLCTATANDDGEPGFDFLFRREYCQFSVI